MNAERELARMREMTDGLLASPPGGPVNEATYSAKEFVLRFRALDAHLSGGGTPPPAWAEGPDEPTMDDLHVGWQDGPERHDPRPEGFGILAHWSTVHEGVNVEMDVPDGLRVTVYYNEWLAVDAEADQNPVVSTP